MRVGITEEFKLWKKLQKLLSLTLLINEFFFLVDGIWSEWIKTYHNIIMEILASILFKKLNEVKKDH